MAREWMCVRFMVKVSCTATSMYISVICLVSYCARVIA